MTVSAESVIASAQTYRLMRQPAKVGDLRVRSWRYLLPPVSTDDPAWAKRCKDYWALQEQTYGLKHSDFAMFIDWEEMIVTTASVVVEVLPGRRERDWVAPAKRN